MGYDPATRPAPDAAPAARDERAERRDLRGITHTTVGALVTVTVMRTVGITVGNLIWVDSVTDDPALFGLSRFVSGLGLVQYASITTGLALLLTPFTGLLLMVWLYQARANAAALTGRPGPLGAGWAIGAWLVPVANLVLPPLVVARTWRDSRPGGPPSPGRAVVVAVWWVAAVLAFPADVVGLYTKGPAGSSDIPADVARSSRLLSLAAYSVGSVLTVLACILLVTIIVRIGRWQRTAAGAAGPPGPSTPRRP